MYTKFPSCSPTPEGLGMLLIHWDHLQRSREAGRGLESPVHKRMEQVGAGPGKGL